MLRAILTFVPVAALLVIAPGPHSLLVLRNAARGGRRAGLATAAGTVTGLLVWATAAALGLAALVRASQIGYLAVRLALLHQLPAGLHPARGTCRACGDDSGRRLPR